VPVTALSYRVIADCSMFLERATAGARHAEAHHKYLSLSWALIVQIYVLFWAREYSRVSL